MKKSTSTNSSASVTQNKKAFHDYTIHERFEAGLALEGWEVKSLREGRVQLTESYIIIKHNEAWLLGMHIPPLKTISTHIQPQPARTRKLLLHRKEINKLIGNVERKGYTMIPLSLYWKRNRLKLELGLASGKKKHDKRAALKERDWERQKQRLVRGKA